MLKVAAVGQEGGSQQMERKGLIYRVLWEGTGHLKKGLCRTESTGEKREMPKISKKEN